MKDNQFDHTKEVKTADTRMTYEDMQRALALHIWQNDHLREEVLNNPKATIERELKVKFDNKVKINVVNHKDPNEITFILPANIHEVAGQELSDEQLTAAAGGMFGELIGGMGGLVGGLMETIGYAAGANKGQMEKIGLASNILQTTTGIASKFIP